MTAAGQEGTWLQPAFTTTSGSVGRTSIMILSKIPFRDYDEALIQIDPARKARMKATHGAEPVLSGVNYFSNALDFDSP